MYHIREQLPALKERINEMIVDTQTELAAYGDVNSAPVTGPMRGTLLLRLISSYVASIQEAINGGGGRDLEEL